MPPNHRPAQQRAHGEKGELRIDQLQAQDCRDSTEQPAPAGAMTQAEPGHHRQTHQRHGPGQMRRHRDQVRHAGARDAHLGGTGDDRPDVDLARQERADAAPQAAEQEGTAPPQPWPKQFPGQHEDRGQ